MINLADTLLRWCKTNVLIVGPIVAFCALAGAIGSIKITEISPFCGTCHSMKTVHRQWSNSTHAKPRVGKEVGCSDCHVRDGVIGLVQDHIVNGNFQLLAEFTHTHVPAKPTVVTAMYDSRCVACHRSVASRDDELSEERLPEKLKDVGLVVPHRNHYELREYTAMEAKELAALREKEKTQELDLKEKDEFARLEKVEKGNCAQCHERLEVGHSWRKDRSVHLKQPMTCVSCHKKVVHKDEHVHGRPIPSRQTCASCHDGSYHGKLGVIFSVGCLDGAPNINTLSPVEARDCMKCHPKVQELFIRRARASSAGK